MVRITLGPFDSVYLEQARKWRNDPKINRWCRQNDFITDSAQVTWFKNQANDPTIKMYAVKFGPVLVGVCGLTSLDLYNRKAEFSLYIGTEHQRKGFAREALAALLDHGFNDLGLNLIWGETFEGNPAFDLFVSLGFVPSGRMPQAYFKDGRFIDSFLMSILKEEWLGQVSSPDTDSVDADGVLRQPGTCISVLSPDPQGQGASPGIAPKT